MRASVAQVIKPRQQQREPDGAAVQRHAQLRCDDERAKARGRSDRRAGGRRQLGVLVSGNCEWMINWCGECKQLENEWLRWCSLSHHWLYFERVMSMRSAADSHGFHALNL
jgi:hypothetical protein